MRTLLDLLVRLLLAGAAALVRLLRRLSGGSGVTIRIDSPGVAAEPAPVEVRYRVIRARRGTLSVEVEFSLDGGSSFRRASEAPDPRSEGTEELAADAAGKEHLFVWDATRDLGADRAVTVALRIAAAGEDRGVAGVTAEFLVVTRPPREVRLRGGQLLLIEREAEAGAAGGRIAFDLDRDGSYEREVGIDGEGAYSVALEEGSIGRRGLFAARASAPGAAGGAVRIYRVLREDGANPADAVPENLLPANSLPPEPEICTCAQCPPDQPLSHFGLDGFTSTLSPTRQGVELATGKVRLRLPVVRFETRRLGFELNLHHSSLVRYSGPLGSGVSHTFNLMIVETGELSGLVITPDLRIYEIGTEDGESWTLPRGFFGRLTLDRVLQRWTMTHFSGLRIDFYRAAAGLPGRPLRIVEPNGNVIRLEYEPGGRLRLVTTDLGQRQRFEYGEDDLLTTFTDHIGRSWTFARDSEDRLSAIATPEVEHARVPAGALLAASGVAAARARAPLGTQLEYGDLRYPTHVTGVLDPRGARPRGWRYDDAGRVQQAVVNGRAESLDYAPTADPPPLRLLDPWNRVTRVTDRMGNVVDHEIHGAAGGPLQGRGRYALRRLVTWTAKGSRRSPLREGEPDYWEERYLHDCRCLVPSVVVQPFASTDASGLEFDEVGIPVNWPREIFTFNRFRQIVRREYTDGERSLVREAEYQARGFGDGGEYSLLVRRTDPRAFGGDPLYEDLQLDERFDYDEAGNRVARRGATVTRGVPAPQPIEENWTYNSFGQPLSHRDPNGNVTRWRYYESEGEGDGGYSDINARDAVRGYLASVTVGDEGSTDSAPALTTTYFLNALGITTRTVDPRGNVHDDWLDELGRIVRSARPETTLTNGETLRAETERIRDAAGNVVLERRTNLDGDGSERRQHPADVSFGYDAVNNLLEERVMVDEEEANALIDRYAYDGNDDLAVTRRPEGNRTFWIYDERRLPFRIFSGIGPAEQLFDDYPTEPGSGVLRDTDFLSSIGIRYDARRNAVEVVDGRGYASRAFFDFHNRQVGWSDPNGNGWTRSYDAASAVIAESSGIVSRETGSLERALQRTDHRYDEAGRRYLSVRTLTPEEEERATAIDPTGPGDAATAVVHDAGSRPVATIDANGNRMTMRYDAANRRTEVTDPLGNAVITEYDAASNPVRVTERELPSSPAPEGAEEYVTTYAYDALDRLVEISDWGRDGAGPAHTTRRVWDSLDRLVSLQDPAGRFTRRIFDDAGRMLRSERYDRSPTAHPGEATLLQVYQHAYDGNGRTTEDRVLRIATVPESAQVTRYAYDLLDRRIRIVAADSDDPIDGSGPGADGVDDRVEREYDANSNLVRVTDQREVVVEREFDGANRLLRQHVSGPAEAGGARRVLLEYDALNRTVGAANEHASVAREWDPLSRLTREVQEVRVDGRGFEEGWTDPVEIASEHDAAGNRTRHRVISGGAASLEVRRAYDPLNRLRKLSAAAADGEAPPVADYRYLGPRRVAAKTLGAGARLEQRFDRLRRVESLEWRTPDGRRLLGFEYAYDAVDRVTSQRVLDDGERTERYTYDARDQLIAVESASGTGAPTPAAAAEYAYDDVFNRESSRSDLLPEEVREARYEADAANEYVSVRVGGRSFEPRYDRAGNATRLLVRPTDTPAAEATAEWDAHNRLIALTPADGVRREYLYDPFGRRVAALERTGSGGFGGDCRRFLYDDWTVVEERILPGTEPVGKADSVPDRVHVEGRALDEILLTAFPRGAGAGADRYHLTDRLGSLVAALAMEGGMPTIERFRYDAFGYPVQPRGGAGASPLAPRFTGRPWDAATGLYDYRTRQYEPVTGRFISRDTIGDWGDPFNLGNGYAYVGNNPTNLIDPMGRTPDCVAAAIAGFVIGCGVSIAAGTYQCIFGDATVGDLVQGCVCDGLLGTSTALGACIGVKVGWPTLGGCIGGIVGAVINTLCTLVGNLVRGKPMPRGDVEFFKGAIATALGCLGGAGVGQEVRNEIQLQAAGFAAAVWNKVLDYAN